jgi:beta-N-acetylglucosaminidase
LPQTQHIQTNAQIVTCNTEDIFDLLNSNNQVHTNEDVFETRKQRAIEEAEKPEPVPESEERNMTFLKLTEELGLFEDRIKVFEETDCQEQRTATTRQEVMRMLNWL